ncbi:MAG: hypothetical protein R3C59_03135 [Planctomycetaceae bacterium]
MQTSLPKIAAVLLTISAVSFMGMAVASFYGRPDPVGEMEAPEIDDYKFEATAGADRVTWTVTPTVGADQSPKQKNTAYEALLEAYKDKETKTAAETAAMTELTARLTEKVTQVEAEQKEDIAAVERKIQSLTAFVTRADAAVMEASQELQRLSVETREIRDETSQRREDVIRLQSDLEELRTDRFRLEQQRLILTDRLVRLQLENQAIDQRLKQLETIQ